MQHSESDGKVPRKSYERNGNITSDLPSVNRLTLAKGDSRGAEEFSQQAHADVASAAADAQ